MIDGYTPIRINRNNLFDDAYNTFMNMSPQELKKGLHIIYEGEDGIDAGGLLRYFSFSY